MWKWIRNALLSSIIAPKELIETKWDGTERKGKLREMFRSSRIEKNRRANGKRLIGNGWSAANQPL